MMTCRLGVFEFKARNGTDNTGELERVTNIEKDLVARVTPVYKCISGQLRYSTVRVNDGIQLTNFHTSHSNKTW